MNQHALHLVLHNPATLDGQARTAITKMLVPFCETLWKRGIDAIALTAEPQEDALTTEQRGYYHAGVLDFIAEHGRANGVQYPREVWKEHFRDKFLGFKVRKVIDPMTGKKSRRRIRISTEDLGVQGYARLIDLVIAFASTELGLTVPPPIKPLPKWRRAGAKVDADTGEILGPH